MRRVLIGLLLLVLLATGAAGGLRLLETRPGPLPGQADLVVPHGRLQIVGQALQSDRVLASGQAERWLFMVLARGTALAGAGPLHAAEFHFPAHASIRDVLAILRRARPVQHPLTIPEGLTAAQIAGLLTHAPFLTGDLALPDEGTVLPQTYASELGTTRAALVERMQAAMTRTVQQVWAGRDPSVPLQDPAQLVSLASIVERETAIEAERKLVAEVFLNRLRQGMKLQSDPTVAYGAGGGLGALPRPLTRSDLVQPNPYNTYVIPGLPPGPISAPGLASLQAVAHPAQGLLLFFVADGTGGHAFSASLPEHLHNVAQLRALEAGRPGQMPSLDPLRAAPQVEGQAALSAAPGRHRRHGR